MSGKEALAVQDTPEAIVERLYQSRFFERLYGKQDRFIFRNRDCRLEIQGDTNAAGIRAKMVTTESLGFKDIAFLSPLFLYTGTRVFISLRDLMGTEKRIEGKIVKCEHAVGLHHVALLEFAQPVRLDSFVVRGSVDIEPEPVDPENFTANLLFIDDSQLDTDLIRHLLSKTKVNVHAAATLESAIELARSGTPIDLILCDANLGNMTGDKVIAGLRAAGVVAPACGISAETNQSMLKSLARVCHDHMLSKPVSSKRLISTLQNILNEDKKSKIHSRFAAVGDLKPMIAEVVRGARSNSEKLLQALQLGDAATIRMLAIRLKSSATACGFDLLSQTSSSVVLQIDEHVPMDLLQMVVQRLAEQCLRLDIEPAPKKVA